VHPARQIVSRIALAAILVVCASCGNGLPALLRSVPSAGEASVASSAWIDLEFEGDVPAVLDGRFALACEGNPQPFAAQRVAPRRVALNPQAALPAGAACEVRWTGPSGPTSLSFSTRQAASSAQVLYDRDGTRSLGPYPDDYFLASDPATETGVRLALEVPPDAPPALQILLTPLIAIANRIDGFSPIGPIVTELSAPLAVASLPRSPEASLDPLASIGLFDVDPASSSFGARIPFRATTRTDTTGEGHVSHVLLVFPSVPLEPKGRYALAITRRVLDAAGDPIGPSAFFEAALAPPAAGDSDALARVRTALAPALDALERAALPRIPREDLALLLGIRIRSTTTLPDDLRAIRRDVLSAPAPGFTIASVRDHYCCGIAAIVEGTWDAPDYRDGLFLARDAAGAPVRQRTRAVPFTLALPESASEAPAPLILHQHGQTSNAAVQVPYQAEQVFAATGFAVVGFTDILNREVGQDYFTQIQSVLLNTLSFEQVPDFWVETHAEQIAFARMLPGLASLDVLPLGAPDGVPDLDLGVPISYHGISEGANHGQAVLPYLPGIGAAALVVGGTRLTETLMHSSSFGVLPALDSFIPEATAGDIWTGIALFQAGYDAQDAHHQLRHLYREPESPESPRPSVLVQEGLGDTIVPNNATESLAAALLPIPQLPPIARPVPFLPTAIAPVSGNVDAETTAALAQFVPDGFPGLPASPDCVFEYEGHFCPQGSSAAREQIAAFYRSRFDGVPVVLEADGDRDADGLRDTAEILFHATDPEDPDTDGDGLADGAEVDADLDPLDPADATLDLDGDGLSNLEEHLAGTDPRRADSDFDSLPDGIEVNVTGTDPLDGDSDDDGLRDAPELQYGANPLAPDSDGDGLPDGTEVQYGLDPTNATDLEADHDTDGLRNGEELALGSDPRSRDTDGDDLDDASEVASGSDPRDYDTDGGGRSDGQEANFDGTSPIDAADDEDSFALTDGSGATWFLERDGSAYVRGPRQGSVSFDRSNYFDPGTIAIESEEQGRELVFPTVSVPVRSSRKVFVPGDVGVVRYLETVENTGSSTASSTIDLFSSVSGVSLRTSDGDATPETTDRWLAWDDGPGGEPAMAQVFAWPGRLGPSLVSASSFTIRVRFNLTLPARTRAAVVHYVLQAADLDAAAAAAASLAALPDAAIRGLSGEEFRAIANLPLLQDLDSDGLPDRVEEEIGTRVDLADTDGDGLSDSFEDRYGFDPLVSGDGPLDPDADGLTNLEERDAGTDPTRADGDRDGADDAAELATGSNPFVADSDGDELPDGFEIRFGLSPTSYDSPYDDSDGDGLYRRDEAAIGSDPRLSDTDGDGISDGDEASAGLDPSHPGDAAGDRDGDGLSNLAEAGLGTRLDSRDSDFDGLGDGVELRIFGTDPLSSDSDSDDLEDGQEILRGADPLRSDTDGDGILDGAEVDAGLDPRNPADGSRDDDGDGLDNAREVEIGTSVRDPDSDGDELGDGDELLVYGCDPTRSDTDFGGRNDRFEVLVDGTDPYVSFDDRVTLFPTVTLSTPFGSWRVDREGDLTGRSSSSFLEGLGSSAYGLSASSVGSEALRRELIYPPVEEAGLVHRRKVYVPSDDTFVRYLEILENETDSEIQTSLEITTTLPTNLEVGLVASSNPDGVLDATDDSFVLDDAADPGQRTPFVHVYAGPGAAVRPAEASADLRLGGSVSLRFDLRVPARGRAIVLHFGAEPGSRILADFDAGRLTRPEGRALFDLSDDERRDVVNYALAGDADRDGVADGADVCPGVADPGQGDGDGDRRGDVCDNCLLDANPSQRDSDADGFGNECDGDLSGDRRIWSEDLSALDQVFGRRRGEPGFDPDADLDGDGVVGLPDFNRLRDRFGAAPGPSALSCAGQQSFSVGYCPPY